MMYIKRLIRNLNSLCCTGKISRISCRGKKNSCENEANISFVGDKWVDVRRELFDVCPFVPFHIGINGCTICAKNIMKIKFKKRNKVQFNLAGVFSLPDHCSL